MIDSRYAKAAFGIVALFAIGLVFYFAFSASLGDGLERTMEDAGIEEQGGSYTGPLSYGDDYLAAFAAGLAGAGMTFAVVYAFFRFARRHREAEEKE